MTLKPHERLRIVAENIETFWLPLCQYMPDLKDIAAQDASGLREVADQLEKDDARS